MDQPKGYERVWYGNTDPRNEGLGSMNQRFSDDPSTNISANMRPPDYGMSVPARPVLNFSIQTGEEFEFMRDRVNPIQHFLPNAYSEPSRGPVFVDLKGVIGVSHPLSESGSNTSVLSSSEKHHTPELGRKAPSLEDKSYHDPVQSVPRKSSRNDSSQRLHNFATSRASDSSSNKVKFLCSFGGKILPRPSDRKLRYVGGETRIIRINKVISWQELEQKTLEIYNEPHIIKYQLPGEDLDALISVSCDEDLQNIMEECNVLGNGESQKLRMFLFSNNDIEEAQFSMGSVEGDSEIQYIVAVNGMDLSSRKSFTGIASASRNNLDGLLSINVDQDANRVASEPGVASIVPLALNVRSSPTQTSQQLAGFVTDNESYSQPYLGHQVQLGRVMNQPVYASAPKGSTAQTNGTRTSALYVQQPEYDYGSNYPLNPLATLETSVPLHAHNITQQGVLREDKMFNAQDPEPPVKEYKLKRDGSSHRVNELIKVSSADNNVPMLPKLKREFSTPRVNEAAKGRLPENESVVSSIPGDHIICDHIPKEEASIVTQVASSAPDTSSFLLQDKNVRKSQDLAQNSGHFDIVGDGRKTDQDGQFYLPGGVSTSGYGSSGGDLTNLSNLEQHVIHQRIFYSEQIPREQAETNRLSKSNDFLGSQFVMTQASSEFLHIIESAEKLHEANVALQTVQSVSPVKLPFESPVTITDGLPQFGKDKDLNDKINKMNSTTSKDGVESIPRKSEVQHIVNSMDDQDLIVHSMNQNEAGLLNHPTSQSTSVDPSQSPTQNPSEYGQSSMAANRDQDHEIEDPVRCKENPVKAVPQGESAIGTGIPEQGDIVVDINDRFPRDFLSDIFLKAKDSIIFSGLSPLHVDGTGVSLNVENHEPKNWSYFRNLAQDEFVRKDVSLMDQDHPSFPSSSTNTEGASVDYSYPPFQSDKVALNHVDPQINFDENGRPESSILAGSNTTDTQQHFSQSQVKHDESVQVAMNTGVPLLDLLAVDFDISTLQIIKNEDLEELKELGSGTFGTVYHGKWRGTDVAIKRFKKNCFIGRSSEQERLSVEFWREAEILSKLHHPNVVAFYGVVQDGPGGTLATVAEYMVNGSLRHVLLSNRQLDRRKRLVIAMDAAFGMEYLHSKNIVHFDLKCDNLLVNLKDPTRPICKVGDFGLSKIKRNTLITGGVRGTLPWMAPELLNGGSSKVSEKVDVFSFAIVLWEILTGEEPYANMHYGAIIGGIVSNSLRPSVPSYCDPEWRLLMEQCWAPDPVARPSFTEIARRLRLMSSSVSQTKPHGNPAPK